LEVAPPWLQRKWGRRFLESIGLLFDAYSESAYQAVLARFVAKTPGDGLVDAGAHYILDRLLGETDDQYRRRLLRAYVSYRQGGSSAGLQARLREAGYSTATVIESHEWSTDDGGSWARFWVLWPTTTETIPAPWDTSPGTWSDGAVWEDLYPQEPITQIKALARKWRAAHAKAVSLIVLTSGETWDYPSGYWSDPGTWDASTAEIPLS
jgi:hypothetical protein